MLDVSRLRKPTEKAFIESLNGKFQAECLNARWLMSLEVSAEKWRIGVSTIWSGHTARPATSPYHAPESVRFHWPALIRHPMEEPSRAIQG